MITIGITGGYATGKTAVTGMFRQLGAKVVEADRIARVAVKPYSVIWRKVVKYFGNEIIRKDNSIKRQKLAEIIFKDSGKRRKLSQLVHPYVIAEIKKVIKIAARRRKVRVLVVDAPLLYEAGIEELFDKVIVVTCSAKAQCNRAKRRDRVPSAQILQRVRSQWPLSRKIKKADFVVDNSRSIVKTRKQVKEIWKIMTNKRTPEAEEVL